MIFEGFSISQNNILLTISSMLIGIVFYYFFFRALVYWANKSGQRTPMLMRQYFYRPGLVLFVLLALLSVSSFICENFTEDITFYFNKALYSLFIVNIAWLLVRSIDFTGDMLNLYYYTRPDPEQGSENLRLRSVNTQFQVIRKISVGLIIIIGVGIELMQFDRIRELGTTLLASAGILSVIVGFAAQRSISTLLAGIQIALAQPIKLEDVVIVEGEWGRVEEINLTYVVIRIWDERRLVVPISYFIEKPFQNWTKKQTEICGVVFLHVDYTLPLDQLRQALDEMVRQNPRWDGRKCQMQVFNAHASTIELRVFLSASNADELFDLRCDVREGLITYIQRHYPQSLPRTRVEWKQMEA